MYSIVRFGAGNPFYLLFFAFLILAVERDETGKYRMPLLETGAQKNAPAVVAQNVIRVAFLAITLAGAVIQSFFWDNSAARVAIPVISVVLIAFLVALVVLECRRGEPLYSGRNIRWLALLVLFGFWLVSFREQLPWPFRFGSGG